MNNRPMKPNYTKEEAVEIISKITDAGRLPIFYDVRKYAQDGMSRHICFYVFDSSLTGPYYVAVYMAAVLGVELHFVDAGRPCLRLTGCGSDLGSDAIGDVARLTGLKLEAIRF